MKFRTDINAIRSYAVLSVVLFHFFPTLLPGGFAGVDIFFVVSGYLMTSIIVSKLATGSFSLLSFYHARVVRIVPALSVLCIVLLVYGWFFLLPTDYQTLAKHTASSQFFLSNFIYLREAGYFTAGSHEKWLLHTWSLSVEWQFYMIYPVMLWLVAKNFGQKTLAAFISVLLVASFCFSVVWSFKFPDSSYFMIYTRAWEMLAGGLIFFLTPPRKEHAKKYLSYGGFALIFLGLLITEETMAWPGYMALLPVVGTCLILYANVETLLVRGKQLHFTGLVSYSIYLWHWPIVVFISYMGLIHNNLVLITGVLFSFVLGALSYLLVEKKLTSKIVDSSKYPIYLIAAVVFAISVVIYTTQGAVSKFRPVSMTDKAKFIQEYKDIHAGLHDSYWLKCNAYKSMLDKKNTDIDPSCVENKSGLDGVFLWGDSHAEAFSYGIRKYIGDKYAFYQVTSAGCAPSFEPPNSLAGDFYVACTNSNKYALQKITDLKPKVVIVTQANNHEKTDWNAMYEKLSAVGVRTLIVIGPLAQWQPSLPSVIAKRHWDSDSESIIDSSLSKTVINTNTQMLQMKLDSGIKYANVFDQVCKHKADNYLCLVRLGEQRRLIAVDYGHLSIEGSTHLTEKVIYPLLFKAMTE